MVDFYDEEEERRRLQNGVTRTARKGYPANSDGSFTPPPTRMNYGPNLSAVAQELNDPGSADLEASPAANVARELEFQGRAVQAPPPRENVQGEPMSDAQRQWAGGYNQLGQPTLQDPAVTQSQTDAVKDFVSPDGFGADLVRNIPGAFPETIGEAKDTQLFDDAYGRMAAAESAEGKGAAAPDVLSATAGQMARTTGGFLKDVARNAHLDDAASFVKGMAGRLFGDGPPAETAGEEPVADLTNQTENDDAVAPVEAVRGTEEPESPSLVSDQPGVESTPAASPRRRSSSGVADRLLGPPVPDEADRQGIEYIRGMRRTFQETDAEGREIGGERPFGEGVFQRARNLGMGHQQATDFAVAVQQQEAAMVNAGANALRAKTSAVLPLAGGTVDGNGQTQNTLLNVRQDGSYEIWQTGVPQPVAGDIMTIKEPSMMIGPDGLGKMGSREALVQVVRDKNGKPVSIRRLMEDESEADQALRGRYSAPYEALLQEYLDQGYGDDQAAELAMEDLKAAQASRNN